MRRIFIAALVFACGTAVSAQSPLYNDMENFRLQTVDRMRQDMPEEMTFPKATTPSELAQLSILKMKYYEARVSGLMTISRMSKQKELKGHELNELADAYFVAGTYPQASREVIKDAWAALLESKGSSKSAAQVTQTATEEQMKLSVIQVAQNARIIQLLEKLLTK